MGAAGNSTSLAPDIPNMGDQTFKVGKLSVEQRKEKIHRYMKKRNERNFSKKIKVMSLSSLPPSMLVKHEMFELYFSLYDANATREKMAVRLSENSRGQPAAS